MSTRPILARRSICADPTESAAPSPGHIDALRRAITAAGCQTSFGDLFGKSQQLVSYWISSGQGLPPELVLQTEEETGVPRWELRPDIYPPTLGAGPAAASPGTVTAGLSPDTKSFPGDFMVTFRASRRTFDEAEAVAQALLTVFPDETYYIARRVARVKMKPSGGGA